MRLRTIWTLPAMTLRERLRRTRDWAAMEVAWKLPKPVLYWAAVRAACLVEPDTNPSGVTAEQMMEKIGHDH
jgi:hypothetical protein